MSRRRFSVLLGVFVSWLFLAGAAFAHDLARLEQGFPLAHVDDERFAELFREDQRDRFEGVPADVMRTRDAERREQMAALLLEEPDMGAAEWFIAAIIFQHGAAISDYMLARRLAQEGYEETGHPSLGWMIAATTDRARLSLNEDQLYGTQFRCVDGRFVARPIEDSETIDARRAELGLQSFADYAARSQEHACDGP